MQDGRTLSVRRASDPTHVCRLLSAHPMACGVLITGTGMNEIHLSAEGLASYAPKAIQRRAITVAQEAQIGIAIEMAKGFGYVVGAGLAGGLALCALQAKSTKGLVVNLLTQPIGLGLLSVVSLCFLSWSAWTAYLVVRRRDSDPESIFRRFGTGAGGFAHFLVAIAAASSVLGFVLGEETPLTAILLVPAAGASAIFLFAATLAIAGAMQIYRAIDGELEERLAFPPRLDPPLKKLLRFAQLGVIARGLAMPIIGSFLAMTASMSTPFEPMGIAEGLEAALARPAGPYMLLSVAIASAVYGMAAVAVKAFQRAH
jgi:hypothetical protein